MDPFQTQCTMIEPYLIDSPSVMLSSQLGHKLNSPAKNVISDIFIIISPSCPLTSLVAMNTYLYQYICSITLCRDLYM